MKVPDIQTLTSARERISAHIHRTPIVQSSTLSEMFGCKVFLKAELFQKTGSFKVRGMLNRLMTMDAESRARGVITFSAGNAAQGLAYAASIVGVKAVVAMPEVASPTKVAATRGYGAEVILHGKNAAETFERCMQEVESRGLTYVPSYDDEVLMQGHASLGLELLEDVPDATAVFCGIGGGGLIGGLAMALRAQGSKARIIGVEPMGASCMSQALAAGRPVQVTNERTLADGLAPPIAGASCLPYVTGEVEQIALVTEEQLSWAISFLLSRCKLLVEGAGAAPLAALKSRGDWGLGSSDSVVLMLCGGNIDMSRLAPLLA